MILYIYIRKQNNFHVFINIFALLNDKYFIRSIIFLFVMIALLAHALKIFPLIIVFSLENSRLMFSSRRGNNNLSLRLANRANSFIL